MSVKELLFTVERIIHVTRKLACWCYMDGVIVLRSRNSTYTEQAMPAR